MLGYLREYWGGFFPLLLVEVQEGGEGGAPLDPREVRAGWPSFIECHHGEKLVGKVFCPLTSHRSQLGSHQYCAGSTWQKNSQPSGSLQTQTKRVREAIKK